jgi:quercetin dioxygenase-like cupin family protein
MKKNMDTFIILCLALVVILSAGFTAAEKQDGKSGKIALTPGDLKWNDGPAAITGSKLAVLEGDPKKSGFFVMRLKLPAGGKIPPHTHENVERVTVISGKLNLAEGRTAKNPKVLPAGSFFVFQPGIMHNAWADGETVLQISTEGPWTFNPVKQ